MLLERGPIDPIDVDAQLHPSSLPALVASVSAVTASLGGAQAAIAAQQSVMAGDAGGDAFDTMALELGELDAELARQAGALDPSIGGVAAAAGDQGAQLPGLTNDSAADVASASHPNWPEFNDHGEHPVPPSPPGTPRGPEEEPQPTPEPPRPGSLYDYIASLYRELLDRDGSDGEIQGWIETGLSAQAIRDAFIGSPEYQEKHGG